MEREIRFNVQLDIDPTRSDLAAAVFSNQALLEQILQREMLWAIKLRLDALLEHHAPSERALDQLVEALHPQLAPTTEPNHLWDRLDNAISAMITASASTWTIESPTRRAA